MKRAAVGLQKAVGPRRAPGRRRRASLVLLVGLLLGSLGGAACALRGEGGPSERSAALPLPLPTTQTAITADDVRARVAVLTDPRTEGRATGSPGEALAADVVARQMQSIGLLPAGDADGFLHRFAYTAGIALGPDNMLRAESAPPLEVDRDWRPLAFSRTGSIEPAPVVFAGYGLVAPAEGERPAVDEYARLDVEGRWALVLRDLPTGLDGAARQRLQRYASLRHKAMVARDRGAVGVLFVNGPRSAFREPLAPLRFDAALAGSGLAVITLEAGVADGWLGQAGRELASAQARVDEAWPPTAADDLRFEIPALRIAARIDLETLRREASNVVGRLQLGARPSRETIVLGAHLDHLGHGEGSSSLANADEDGAIHPGADDNASGVAVLLEIAEAIAARRAAGEARGERDLVFAAWSGEELGLLGSEQWAKENVNPHGPVSGPVAYLNFDMVGRLEDEVVLHGAGSSPVWREVIEDAVASAQAAALPLALNDDAYLPTDSTSFYTRGLPILSAFTGVHAEYHTPRDRPELLDAEGAARIGSLFEEITLALAQADAAPAFVAQPLPAERVRRGGLRVFLGTIPDYAKTDVVGVRLAGVAPGGPAEAGGLRRGDTIVEVDGRRIENLYDYTYALEALRVETPVRITVLRQGERLELEVVPTSRD